LARRLSIPVLYSTDSAMATTPSLNASSRLFRKLRPPRLSVARGQPGAAAELAPFPVSAYHAAILRSRQGGS